MRCYAFPEFQCEKAKAKGRWGSGGRAHQRRGVFEVHFGVGVSENVKQKVYQLVRVRVYEGKRALLNININMAGRSSDGKTMRWSIDAAREQRHGQHKGAAIALNKRKQSKVNYFAVIVNYISTS